MNPWRPLLAPLLMGALYACAASPEPPAAAGRVPSVPVSRATQPPCAEAVSVEDGTLRYPAESLYRSAAVLPHEAGLACLQGLANWLKSAPRGRWQVTVSGEEGYGFEPLELAGKRQQLLQRFFDRQGIDWQDWQWQTSVGVDEQLRLFLLKE